MLLGGVIAAGGMHRARIEYSLNADQFDVVIAVLAACLVLLAMFGARPSPACLRGDQRGRGSAVGFPRCALVQVPIPAADAVPDSPLVGEWFLLNGGHKAQLNGHSANESNAIDFSALRGERANAHEGHDTPLADYPGFGSPVLAPVDGYADNPPGTDT